MKKILTVMTALLLVCLCALACAQTKPVILVTSFGTSFNDSREITIGAVEAEMAAAYPEFEVRRAFTAQTIIDKLKARDGIETENVVEALERMAAEGVRQVVVQPTHVMNGFEYDDIVADVMPFADKFDTLVIGKPMLTAEADYEEVIEALLGGNALAGSTDTALVFMGHGTEHFANAAYCELEYLMHAAGYENAFVGTVEGVPSLDHVIAQLDAFGAKKVVLSPLMIVAGDHANNDMAGDEEDSWKTVLTEAGFEVECNIHGMGENEAIRKIIVRHAGEAMEKAGLR